MSVNEVKIKQATVPFQVRGTGSPSSRTFAIGNEDHTPHISLHVCAMKQSDNGGQPISLEYKIPHTPELDQISRSAPNTGDGGKLKLGNDRKIFKTYTLDRCGIFAVVFFFIFGATAA